MWFVFGKMMVNENRYKHHRECIIALRKCRHHLTLVYEQWDAPDGFGESGQRLCGDIANLIGVDDETALSKDDAQTPS